MIKSILILFVSFVILNECLAQDQFCDTPSETSDLKIPTLPVIGQYQALIEKNVDVETEEMYEIYDGLLNVGIVTYYLASIKTKIYSYYGTNELLLISGDNCKVLVLNESYSLTPFQVINLNGVEHIASPLNSITSIPGLEFKFLGSNNVIRGIPVNEWQACVRSPLIQKTVKITASFSNDKKWTPANTIPSYPSIPVQVTVQYKADNETTPKSEIYSIISFRPFLTLDEEDYFTPKGVYCPGRKSIKKIPNIPKSFAFSSQVVAPLPNKFDQIGTIETLFEEYNYKNKLFHFGYSSASSISNEIHDYSTGLIYRYSRKTGRCDILNITGSDIDSFRNGSYVYLRDPSQFFDFDDSNYQYVGMKRMDGINTDVWIGTRQYNGINSTIEWYFLSDLWNLTDYGIRKERYQVPILVKMYVPLPKLDQPNKYDILELKYHIIGFTRIPFIPRDYDIAGCNIDSKKMHFIFELGNDLTKIIRSNLYEFQRSVLEVLQEQMRVTILRINSLQVVFDKEGVYVLFTLLDKVKNYGPVPIPKDDLPLEEAAQRLRDAVEKDKIQIEFKSYDDNDEYIVPIIRNSLAEIGDYREGFAYIERQKVKLSFSSAAVAVVTIVVALVGIVIGVFITVLHKTNKIKLPFV